MAQNINSESRADACGENAAAEHDNNQYESTVLCQTEQEQTACQSAKPEDSAAEAEEAAPVKVEIIGIRFKSAGKVYYFDPAGLNLAVGDNVIVETVRGVEFGTVAIANRKVSSREVITPLRKVLRAATSEDIQRRAKAAATEDRAKKVWEEKALECKLEMDLVDVEYSFDGSKLLFYFTADGRVDFRSFVKELAGVFKTRIELRQIGVRDEAKQVGGLGICGRPFCCSTFLNDFQQVSIKMAKEQGLSLNSAKISGTCGRLMCCLRYENELYEEESKKTPKVDSIVETPSGKGYVIENNVLAGLVKVAFTERDANAAPEIFHRDDVKVIGKRSGNKKNHDDLNELKSLEKD